LISNLKTLHDEKQIIIGIVQKVTSLLAVCLYSNETIPGLTRDYISLLPSVEKGSRTYRYVSEIILLI